ncbi:MAG: hypothetical protein ACKOBH_02800 [bacterium]
MPPAVPNTIFQAGRILIGSAFVVAPGKAGEGWVGDTALSDGGVMARAFGARDIALGVAAIIAERERRGLAPLLAVGVMVDAVDCAATLAAGDRIPRQARMVSATLAAAATHNGVLLLAREMKSGG